MKKYLYLLIGTLFCSILFSSCLRDGIDEAEYSTECDISSVAFEHRWATKTGNIDGVWTLNFKTLTVSSNVDKEAQKVTLDITVPAANGTFTEEERSKVTLSSIACSFVVSRAASVSPLNGAPTLGTLGDYSGKTLAYRVTSASGAHKDWTIVINNFTK